MQYLKITFLLLLVTTFACTSQQESSYWQQRKADFRYDNKTEFVIDSQFRAEYPRLKKISHPLFTNFGDGDAALYSWQDGADDKDEFAVVKDEGEHGMTLFYFILDKKGTLLSCTQLASSGAEGGYWFETQTKFLSRDSLLNIGSITQWLDFETKEKLKDPIGDSTFSHLYIDSQGKVTEKEIKKVIEINYDSLYK